MRGNYDRHALVFFVSVAVVALVLRAPLILAFEDLSLSIDPSAEKAYAYAARHFSSSNPSGYDIDRAEYLLKKAQALDPALPHVDHELARIEFLRGNFYAALVLIDRQIAFHGDELPNSYYVRALLEGYMGRFQAAAEDYEHFLRSYPRNWAAINDYAWVLLKADRAEEAERALAEGLNYFPENPWLLNSEATALYELGRHSDSLDAAQKASAAVARLTEAEWLVAYPGNDPKVAADGIAAFRRAVEDNIHTIEAAQAPDTVQ